MKKLLAALSVTLLAIAGCSKETAPGGPGAIETRTERSYQAPSDSTTMLEARDKDQTFTLTTPATETDLKQGERKEVTLSINRGLHFEQSVRLQFQAPQGLTITPAEPVIKPGETTAQVTIEASADAPIGEASLEVTAVPDTGKPVSMRMPLEVHAD